MSGRALKTVCLIAVITGESILGGAGIQNEYTGEITSTRHEPQGQTLESRWRSSGPPS